MIPLGISTAASALTGNYIGAGKIKLAKRFANLTLIFNVLCTIVVLIVMAIFKDNIASFFTNETEVVDIIKDVFWILLLYIFFDTIHGVQSGIIRGLGR